MACDYGSRRGSAMVLAMVTAVVLSPLYVNGRQKEAHLDSMLWNSGFVLPMLLLGLIIAIKSTSTSSSSYSSSSCEYDSSSSSSLMLRIGGSSWGLAGVLGMLLFLLYWQHCVQRFLWR
ncbi:hypothetical protein SSX86_025840 [Deinandra increscens subsp. villosa]|uniref:Uncharacterized protein n=1 Tax=Deinandra increscens subsp. villosa TaxID=3103831 RepID=A0AAP0CDT7_9ASTR